MDRITLGVSATIFFILAIVEYAVKVLDNFDSVVAHIRSFRDWILRFIDNRIYKRRRDKYNKALIEKEFLDWQQKALEAIYGDLIEEKNQELQDKAVEENWKLTPSIKYAELEIGRISKRYEAVILNLPPIDYPFKGVCEKEELGIIRNLDDIKYPGILKKYEHKTKKYYNFVRGTIRYPKRIGYMLDEITYGGQPGQPEWKVQAYCGKYEDNVKTSHILEFELYQLYKKQRHKTIECTKDTLLAELPIRAYIHKQFAQNGKECDVLTSGKYRVSLLGVQMMVLVKNMSGSYDAIRIRRSNEVAAKPGFLQFIPSGGFEAINDCYDRDSQWNNYSIAKSIFRELLEECFGQDEDDERATGNTVSPDRLYSNANIARLLEYIENDTAQLKLLGTTMSLVSLRQELCFMLVVHDPKFAAQLISNYESKSAPHLMDIMHLEDERFWADGDLDVLNCTSAGLFECVRETEEYRDLFH